MARLSQSVRVTLVGTSILVAGGILSTIIVQFTAESTFRDIVGGVVTIKGDKNEVTIPPISPAVEKEIDRLADATDDETWLRDAEGLIAEYEGPAEYAITVLSSAVQLGLENGQTPEEIMAIFANVHEGLKASIEDVVTRLANRGVAFEGTEFQKPLVAQHQAIEDLLNTEYPTIEHITFAQQKLAGTLVIFISGAKAAINSEYLTRRAAS